MSAEKIRRWLTNYRRLEIEYLSLSERLARLENAQYIPAMWMGVESKRSPSAYDRMGSATIRRLEFEAEYSEKIDEIKSGMKSIETAIRTLPDPLHRGILVQRYIIGDEGCKLKPWKNIALMLYHSDDDAAIKRVQRLHREALESMEKITGDKVNTIL